MQTSKRKNKSLGKCVHQIPQRASIHNREIAAPSKRKGKCQHNTLKPQVGTDCCYSGTATQLDPGQLEKGQDRVSVQGPVVKILTPFHTSCCNRAMPPAHGCPAVFL